MFRLVDDAVISKPSFLQELRVSEVSGLDYLDRQRHNGKA